MEWPAVLDLKKILDYGNDYRHHNININKLVSQKRSYEMYEWVLNEFFKHSSDVGRWMICEFMEWNFGAHPLLLGQKKLKFSKCWNHSKPKHDCSQRHV